MDKIRTGLSKIEEAIRKELGSGKLPGSVYSYNYFKLIVEAFK